MKEFKVFSVEETAEIGFRIGNLLEAGDIICLNGNLGTGKTALTAGIARALNINVPITSPTFTIVNEYKAKIPLFHFDAYRIADSDEMFEIGFEEYIEGNGIVVIEWAELIKDVLPTEYINVEITKDLSKGVDFRILRIDFIGRRYKDYEVELI